MKVLSNLFLKEKSYINIFHHHITEKPDVFTVSVGNLPAQASVMIKITYVTELSVDGPDIHFILPASVSPPQKDKALKEVTQNTTQTVKVDSEVPLGVQVSAEERERERERDREREREREFMLVKTSHHSTIAIQISIDMPYVIERLKSPSHPDKILIKRTATKGTVQLKEGANFEGKPFVLAIGLEKPYGMIILSLSS